MAQERELNAVQIGELKKLHIGQSLDLFWTSNVQCPTFEEYYKMVDYSTYFYRLKNCSRSNPTQKLAACSRW